MNGHIQLKIHLKHVLYSKTDYGFVAVIQKEPKMSVNRLHQEMVGGRKLILPGSFKRNNKLFYKKFP